MYVNGKLSNGARRSRRFTIRKSTTNRFVNGVRPLKRPEGRAPFAVKLRTNLFPVSLRAVSEIKFKNSSLWLLVRVNVLQSWRKLLDTRRQSRLLTGLIGVFVVAYLVLSFELFCRGLLFMAKFPGLGALLTERLMYVLFAFLFALLLLSNLVISYTNLFRNRETAFLLSLPVSTQTIFRWKFIESTLLASWAFLFLIAPLLAAYGLSRGVPWHFYLMAVIALAMFIVLPGVAGAWVALNLARFLDRRAFQIVALIAVAVLLPLMVFYFRPEPLNDN